MRIIGIIALAAGSAGSAAWSAPADACAIYQSAEQRLEFGYRERVIEGRAIVRITSSDYIQPVSGDMHPYRARTVLQSTDAEEVPRRDTFVGGWGSAACDLGYPRPDAGETWVLYYWKDRAGDWQVWLALPLAAARAADPSPQGLPRRR